MLGITRKCFFSTHQYQQSKTTPIKVVNGVLGAYSDTARATKEYESITETHNNYKQILNTLDNPTSQLLLQPTTQTCLNIQEKIFQTSIRLQCCTLQLDGFVTIHSFVRLRHILLRNADNYIKEESRDVGRWEFIRA